MERHLKNLQLIPVYVVLLYTMGLPAWAKLAEHERVIGRYTSMFADTFIARFPGVSPMIYLLGVMEFSVVVLLAVSLGRGEFLPGRPKLWLRWGLLSALFTFAALGFGLRLIADHEGAASQYFYFGVTLLFSWYVERTSVAQAAQ